MAAKKKPETAEQPKYYDITPIEKEDAVYNVIYGQRSFGKTFAMIYRALKIYWEHRSKGELYQFAYLRRYDEAIQGNVARSICDTVICDGNGDNRVLEITGGMFDTIVFRAGEFKLSHTNPETGMTKKDNNPFMYAFAMNTWDKMKGGSFPHVQEIWLEEFVEVSTKPYLKNEFVIFQNVISTLARKRHVKVWLTGNSINPHCPYWDWMGLTKILEQKPGTIDIYKIGKTDRKIAVERTADTPEYSRSKLTNAYLFAFEDPRLKMITQGDWEIGSYPLIQEEVHAKDICGRFFVEFRERLYQGDIVSNDKGYFIYMHTHNDPLYPPTDYDLIYSLDYSPNANYRRRLDRWFTKAEETIIMLFRQDKVFYDSNFTGNAIENYLKMSIM